MTWSSSSFRVLKATKKFREHGATTPDARYRLVCARLLELAVDQEETALDRR
jgi:hypothetical protein